MLFSKEDIEAWKAATRNVRKFLHIENKADSEREALSDKLTPANFQTTAPGVLKMATKKAVNPTYYPDLALGSVNRMERNSFERLKKGKIRPQLVEDLHGMPVFEAQMHFYDLVRAAHASGKRSLLIITGKGFVSPSKIRSSLPNWVNDPVLKPLILSFCQAQPADGGAGAFYVYLAKNTTF